MIDMTAAIDAAAEAAYLQVDSHAGPPEGISWEDIKRLDPVTAHMYREIVLDPINAAIKHIEVQILLRTADELRADRYNLQAALVEARAREVRASIEDQPW